MSVELISIHIKKCGGISFRNSLSRIYQESLSVCYPGVREEAITENTRVIHGHIQTSEYHARYPDAQFITWIREPIERLLSRYFYVRYHFGAQEKIVSNPLLRGIINREVSFLSFIEQAPEKEMMSWYLAGVPLSKFLFIGMMEHFQEDLNHLASMLGWQGDYALVHWNRTEDFIKEEDLKEREYYRNYRISTLERDLFNQRFPMEQMLYHEALELRAARAKGT